MLRKFSKSKTIEQFINRGSSYEIRKKFREKTLLTLCQNRESSLSPKKFYCSFKNQGQFLIINSQ